MKQSKWGLILFLFAVCFASCKAQKNSSSATGNITAESTAVDTASNINTLINQIDALESKQAFNDNALQQLQAKSDIIIMHAVLNFAWTRTINYSIITHENGTWKGYLYKVNMMNKSGTPSGLMQTGADSLQCDSLINFLLQNNALKITGDMGRNFCDAANKSCNINDATSSQLWIVTKKNYISPSYYAPEFFEQCCPEKNRGLFLTITNKIDSAISKGLEK